MKIERKKMVMIISGRKKMIFSEMEKFQRWTTNRDLEWAWDVDVFGLLDVQLSLIWPLMKEFLHAIT